MVCMNTKYDPAAEAIKAFGTDAATRLLAEVLPERHRDLISAAITAGLRDGDLELELALATAAGRTFDLAEQLMPLANELGAPSDWGDEGFYGWLIANLERLVTQHPQNSALAEIRTLHARRLMVD